MCKKQERFAQIEFRLSRLEATTAKDKEDASTREPARREPASEPKREPDTKDVPEKEPAVNPTPTEPGGIPYDPEHEQSPAPGTVVEPGVPMAEHAIGISIDVSDEMEKLIRGETVAWFTNEPMVALVGSMGPLVRRRSTAASTVAQAPDETYDRIAGMAFDPELLDEVDAFLSR